MTHMKRGPKPTHPEVRFWRLVDKTGECWHWIARRDEKGYGRFNLAPGMLVRASRYSWSLANGEIPPGLCVLHRCDTPSCVNPAHLFLGTKADNNRDMMEKGRHPRSRHRTHCARGHEQTGDNVLMDGIWRRCRACRLERRRERRKSQLQQA